MMKQWKETPCNKTMLRIHPNSIAAAEYDSIYHMHMVQKEKCFIEAAECVKKS